MIDTEKETHGQTRKWAAAIHAKHAHVQDLCWTSGQDDSAMAVMLFGDRIGARVLTQREPSRALLADGPAYMELLALAESVGVCLVAGRS